MIRNPAQRSTRRRLIRLPVLSCAVLRHSVAAYLNFNADMPAVDDRTNVRRTFARCVLDSFTGYRPGVPQYIDIRSGWRLPAHRVDASGPMAVQFKPTRDACR